jgi:hypothetical protein
MEKAPCEGMKYMVAKEMYTTAAALIRLQEWFFYAIEGTNVTGTVFRKVCNIAITSCKAWAAYRFILVNASHLECLQRVEVIFKNTVMVSKKFQ